MKLETRLFAFGVVLLALILVACRGLAIVAA